MLIGEADGDRLSLFFCARLLRELPELGRLPTLLLVIQLPSSLPPYPLFGTAFHDSANFEPPGTCLGLSDMSSTASMSLCTDGWYTSYTDYTKRCTPARIENLDFSGAS